MILIRIPSFVRITNLNLILRQTQDQKEQIPVVLKQEFCDKTHDKTSCAIENVDYMSAISPEQGIIVSFEIVIEVSPSAISEVIEELETVNNNLTTIGDFNFMPGGIGKHSFCIYLSTLKTRHIPKF